MPQLVVIDLPVVTAPVWRMVTLPWLSGETTVAACVEDKVAIIQHCGSVHVSHTAL